MNPSPLSGPDALAALGAGILQEPVVESPLPGGVASIVRFLFQTVPQWVQIAGVFLGAAVGAYLAVLLWRRRLAIVAWITTRPRRVRLWLAAAAAAVVLFGASFGAVSWNYMQRDNGFCTGCHVMGPAFQRFVQSEHDSLSCHDCHQQSIFASMRQLYLWVAERPSEIGPHAKVPTEVCATCHVTGEPEVWQRVASTAGHRTHLESDSSALRDVRCVTCHGLEVHRFAPVDSTCGQAGCHISGETGIRLAAMSGQTALHCVTCHQFTAEVPPLATRDSATGTLVPGMRQCFSCHEMRAVLADFDPAGDPHSGTCGMCHNPHAQARAAEARATCTTAGCHADWRAEPFHLGPSHRRAAQQCTTCHLPHTARVDASDCAGCHRAVAERDPRYRRLPLPFDTTRALRRTSWRHAPEPEIPKGKGDDQSWMLAPPDTFSHDRHQSLACITCHTTPQGRGRLTFEPPRGCQICHHQAPRTSACTTCHEAAEYAAPRPATVRVAVVGHDARERQAAFRHHAHGALACTACHTAPVTLGLAPDAARCADCHADHHAASRDCAVCHAGDAMRAAHAPPVDGHVACAVCHRETIVATLVPDRGFCLSCHAGQGDHYPDRACTPCHFQTSPDEFQQLLRRRSAGDG